MKALGELIRDKRVERKLSQKDLSSLLGVTDKTVSKRETGFSLPDLEMTKKLSKELEIPIDDIFDGIKVEKKNDVSYFKKLSLLRITSVIFSILSFLLLFIGIRSEDLVQGRGYCTRPLASRNVTIVYYLILTIAVIIFFIGLIPYLSYYNFVLDKKSFWVNLSLILTISLIVFTVCVSISVQNLEYTLWGYSYAINENYCGPI